MIANRKIASMDTLVVVVAFVSFIVLGLPTGLLNVAYSPYMVSTFNLALGDIGWLLLFLTVGSLLVSFSGGALIARLGMGRFLTIGMLFLGVGMLGYAFLPSWWMVVVSAFVLGMGSGAVDSGMNAFAATNRSPRFMNWMHASFGMGAAVGPRLFELSPTWQNAYSIAGVMALILAVSLGITRRQWALINHEPHPEEDVKDYKPAGIGHTIQLPIVWLGIALFFVYPGVEMATGQWSSTLFTEARGVTPVDAKMWVTIYWSSLTVGRVVLGSLANRFQLDKFIRACMFGVIVGEVLILLNIANEVSFLGLALVGFAQAPVFPLLMSDTPFRVGHAHGPNAIGFQIAAASLGVAAFPALAGILADNLGVEIIGLYLAILAVAVYVLNELSTQWRRRNGVTKNKS